MGLRRKTDEVYDFQLTDTELDILHHVDNKDIRQILKREGAGITATTRAYRAMAARLHAERIMYQEALVLRAVTDQVASMQEAEQVIVGQKKMIGELERELEKTRRDNIKAIAAPAMVIHSDPTGH